MKKTFTSLFFLASLTLSAQDVSVFFIGDAGEPELDFDSNLEYLSEITATADTNDVLLFLGDNLYPNGLPSREHGDRAALEAKLNASLDILKAFPGTPIIIPGNHDWANGKKDGWERLLNMQQHVDAYMGSETVFLPRNACPGPVTIELSPELLLIIIDTQYLLHPWDKPGESQNCEAKSSIDALEQLDDLIALNAHRNIIVAAHHPMYSYGQHGGKYTLKQHLFPLTDVNENLWIPLPVIGSIYPGYRSLIGSRQDIKHPRYKMIRKEMVRMFEQNENLIFISGHEHSLQYIYKDSAHYIVSGAGSKSSALSKRSNAEFHRETKGFARLDYEQDSVALTMFDGLDGKPVYRKTLYHKTVDLPEQNFNFDFEDSTIYTAISKRYTGNSDSYEYWFGKNYRTVWATPVDMPVFNIGQEHGGLGIVKMGGGNQTRSLRLETSDGKQYVLRSLDKYTDKLLPDALHQTLAADILQDQISSANPYGAFAIPALADAAGIFHTNPKLVFVPDDPRFGIYQSTFANIPVLYEERPTSEIAELYDGGEKVDGTPDVIQEIQDDNDETIDQAFALRNRLFDMVIGDWDRHEDQWRWVRYDKEPKGHIWRPIPRDRDQAFFDSEGILGWAASRKFALPNTEGFDETMDWAPGFNTSGRFFDRTFLTSLDWCDWEKEIANLQAGLTDDKIAVAFQSWPDTIQQLAAEETIRILKARRDDMPRYAREHYLYLSKEVEIVGSNKHEHFLIERVSDKETRVTVRKRKKDGELLQVLYQRTFLKDETKEIRIYGLEGEDIFEIQGEVADGIKVRIIGGEDEDTIIDQSAVTGLSKKTWVYDLKANTELTQSSETKSRLSNNPSVNAYNRTAFEYDKVFPLLSAQFNRDDGLLLGAGFIYTKEAWRKEPFAQRHELKANGSALTGAINLYYDGTLSDVIGKWDLNANLVINRPFGVANFFGYGNESYYDYKGNDDAAGFENPINFYRIRYEYNRLFVNLAHHVGQKGMLKIGTEHLSYELEDEVTNKYLNQDTEVENLDASRQFVGFTTELSFDTKNHKGLPTKGTSGFITFSEYLGMNSKSSSFSKLKAEFQFLLSTRLPSRLTVANRLGAEYTVGDIEFYNGAQLGKETIRGYRRTRFVGNSSFYHNLDLRLHLFNFRTYLFPAGVGLITFHDTGRVWYDGESSNKLHTGKGFGLYLSPINQFVITANLAFSEEETLPFVTFGFQF